MAVDSSSENACGRGIPLSPRVALRSEGTVTGKFWLRDRSAKILNVQPLDRLGDVKHRSPSQHRAFLNRESPQTNCGSPTTKVPLVPYVRRASAIQSGLMSRPIYSTSGSPCEIGAEPHPISITLSPGLARTWFRMSLQRSAFAPTAA